MQQRQEQSFLITYTKSRGLAVDVGSNMADQKTGGALCEFPVRTDMHGMTCDSTDL